MRRYAPSTIAALVAALAITAACSDVGPTAAPGFSPSGSAGPSFVAAGDITDGSAVRLLACAAPEEARSAEGVVGPLGGTVKLGNGGSIEIPAGAVPEPTLFRVTVPAAEVVSLEIHAVGQLHYVFEAPVTVRVSYARCGKDALKLEKAEGVYIERGPYRVLEHMGGTMDRDAQTVSFTTGHLSGYAVAF